MSCGVPGCPDCKCIDEGLWTTTNGNGAKAEARVLTQGPRREAYGPPDENHGRTATLWSAYLHARGRPAALSAEDVCWLNVLQKISRDMHSPTEDNLVDSIGYIQNIEEMRSS